MSTHVLPHHFDSAEQAYASSKLGLWLFLVTEVLLFGGLFVVYIIFRALHPETFLEAHHHLNKIMGSINTVVLICSSLTMAMAVDKSKQGHAIQANRYLLVTIACGAIFMVIKYFEYTHKFHEGLLPGIHFTNETMTDPHAPLFFSIYFMMTGLHGIHVLVGMGLMVWIFLRSRKREFGPSYYTPVEMVGLYWHLVDLIWIYLFPN